MITHMTPTATLHSASIENNTFSSICLNVEDPYRTCQISFRVILNMVTTTEKERGIFVDKRADIECKLCSCDSNFKQVISSLLF